jgi:hypothetical protein
MGTSVSGSIRNVFNSDPPFSSGATNDSSNSSEGVLRLLQSVKRLGYLFD